jgi:acyl-CoA dehydrogenase
MPDKSFLSWPFLDERHRALAAGIESWCAANLSSTHGADGGHGDLNAACRDLVRQLGRDGWLAHTAPDPGGTVPLDVRTLCLMRETLARHDALADFAFAMQGLGAGPISLFGNAEQRHWLARTRSGEAIAAFALTEQQSGSDVANIALTARRDGNSYVLDGEKTWISNGGIADHYVVFVRSGEASGAKGLSAFVVDADTPGLKIAERIEVIAPHPLAALRFEDVRVPLADRLGRGGEGFKVAMATLDIFRSTVGAAALGFARRALSESIERAATRKLFGAPLAELQMTQAAIAESASEVDASALLIYRAAWTKDRGAVRVTREAAMAKMFATEAAQRVIDRAVQIHGGLGVTKGAAVEKLYREIRALRIYEGATEVQKIVIARELLKRRMTQASLAAE